MVNPLLDDVDDVIENDPASEAPPAPDPAAEARVAEDARIAKIAADAAKVAVAGVIKDLAPPAPPGPPSDPPHPGYTPEEIVQASNKAGRIVRQAERELRATYAGKLSEDEIERVVDGMSSMPYAQIEAQVQQKAHLAAADMLIGAKVRSGEYNPNAPQRQVRNPSGIGSTVSPREGGGGATTIEREFAKFYGKPRTKGQQDRLRGGY